MDMKIIQSVLSAILNYYYLENTTTDINEEKVYQYFITGDPRLEQLLMTTFSLSHSEVVKISRIAYFFLLSNAYRSLSTLENKSEYTANVLAMLSDCTLKALDYWELREDPEFKEALKYLIRENYMYIQYTYIDIYQWNQTVIKNHTLPVIIRINPFEIFTYFNMPEATYYAESEFVMSEILNFIYEFREEAEEKEEELFEAAEEEIDDDPSVKVTEEEDRIIAEVKYQSEETDFDAYVKLRESLIEYYGEKSDQIFLYLAARTYELLSVSRDTDLSEEYRTLKAMLQYFPKEVILDRLAHDDLVFADLINYFEIGHRNVDEMSLPFDRAEAKRQHLEPKIKKLNPFYQEEESKWKQRLK